MLAEMGGAAYRQAVSTARELWEKVYRRFDPEEPAEAPWRAKRPYAPSEDILAQLARPGTMGRKHFVIFGTVGGGKSTELRALAEGALPKSVVVLVDLYQHFLERLGDPAALEQLQPWEAVAVVGLSVVGAAQRFHRPVDTERLQTALQDLVPEDGKAGTLNVLRLAGGVAALAGTAVGGIGTAAGAGLSALGTALSAGKWDLPLGLSQREPKPDQDPRVQRLVEAVHGVIADLQDKFGRLTLVIDGLDRIESSEASRRLLVDSALLGGLPCAVVLSAPIALRREGMASRVRGFDPKPLHNVPVLRQDEPSAPNPLGMAFFAELWRLRTSDLENGEGLIPPALLERLAFYSGGHLRQLTKLVRTTAEFAWDADVLEATSEHVDASIEQWRQTTEAGLTRHHLDILEQVREDPAHLLPDTEGAADLLVNRWLLPYPNQSTWYYPNPLLSLGLMKRA